MVDQSFTRVQTHSPSSSAFPDPFSCLNLPLRDLRQTIGRGQQAKCCVQFIRYHFNPDIYNKFEYIWANIFQYFGNKKRTCLLIFFELHAPPAYPLIYSQLGELVLLLIRHF